METDASGADPCPIRTTFSFIGGKYKPVILWSLHLEQMSKWGKAVPPRTDCCGGTV